MFRKLFQKSYDTVNVIEVDSERLLKNINFFAEKSGQEVCPVLKSNAYGHGIEQVASIIDGYVNLAAVDGYFEANRIIKNTRGVHVICMGYVKPENFRHVDTRRVSFVVQSVDDLRAIAKCTGRNLKIHLEINTGMNRMGLKPDEIDDYLRELACHDNFELEGIMTHLADADNADPTFTDRQVEIFDECVDKILDQGFAPKYFHIAASAGALKVKSRFANLIRLGIGTYGINPLTEGDPLYDILQQNLRPTLTLKSTIIKTIDLKEGDSVSYGCTFTAERPMRVAVLPLGYYEAIPRELSGVSPIVGRVCMNHTIIDITDKNLKTGSVVTVVSNNPNDFNSVNRLWRDHEIFPWDFLCKLSSDIRRRVV
ncbi:alanine racemase [Candidatus Saccharibacteria bacterium]|nr:alanine racemase [Candidatus Saccharibacteria bacterium]MCL1962845.1 alanine racemase [Candidatus Saccharibacteria bacterium]